MSEAESNLPNRHPEPIAVPKNTMRTQNGSARGCLSSRPAVIWLARADGFTEIISTGTRSEMLTNTSPVEDEIDGHS